MGCESLSLVCSDSPAIAPLIAISRDNASVQLDILSQVEMVCNLVKVLLYFWLPGLKAREEDPSANVSYVSKVSEWAGGTDHGHTYESLFPRPFHADLLQECKDEHPAFAVRTRTCQRSEVKRQAELGFVLPGYRFQYQVWKDWFSHVMVKQREGNDLPPRLLPRHRTHAPTRRVFAAHTAREGLQSQRRL